RLYLGWMRGQRASIHARRGGRASEHRASRASERGAMGAARARRRAGKLAPGRGSAGRRRGRARRPAGDSRGARRRARGGDGEEQGSAERGGGASRDARYAEARNLSGFERRAAAMTQRIEEMAMERNQRAVPALLAGALLAGCGSMPQQNDMLEQARSLVQTLEREPTSDRVAREQLAAARNAIEQADAQSGERRGQEDVEYHSYVALRNAQIAEQLVSTERARAQPPAAAPARTRVRLHAP